MSDVMTVHETLVGARNLIEREGWHRFLAGQGNCAVQATYNAAGGTGAGLGASRAADAAVARFIDSPASSPCSSYRLMAWNDAPGRTKAEVLAAFDEAIAATAPAPDLQLTVEEPVLVHG